MRRNDLKIPWPIAFAWLVLRDSVTRFQRHRCTTAAAAIAFHVLFSVFPLILLVTAILGTQMRNAEARQQVVDGLLRVLPLETSASDLAWEGQSGTRPFLHGKLVDAVLLAIVVSVVLSSFLAGLILSIVPQVSIDVMRPESFSSGLAAAVRSSLAPAVSILTSGSVLVLAYKFLPRPRPAMRYALAGAAVAACLLEAARRIFSIYVDRVATYDIVYGSIGSIIVFLFFVYIAAMVILYGAELGASLDASHHAV